MIALSPLASWGLLFALAALALLLALAVAQHYDDEGERAWREGAEEWEAMCRALDLYNADPYDQDDEEPQP
jgi:hypothetical protein